VKRDIRLENRPTYGIIYYGFVHKLLKIKHKKIGENKSDTLLPRHQVGKTGRYI